MTLDEFDEIEVDEGYQFELGRGVVVVSEVPVPKHLAVVNQPRRFIHPAMICVATSGDSVGQSGELRRGRIAAAAGHRRAC